MMCFVRKMPMFANGVIVIDGDVPYEDGVYRSVVTGGAIVTSVI